VTALKPPADPIIRANGKPYRPRKVTGHAVADEWDMVIAVLVLGTHDIERARPLAEECVQLWVDSSYTAASPVTGWWRDGMWQGQRWWVDDPVRGRAGVRFEAVEAS
jgi:hypothetical protein